MKKNPLDGSYSQIRNDGLSEVVVKIFESSDIS